MADAIGHFLAKTSNSRSNVFKQTHFVKETGADIKRAEYDGCLNRVFRRMLPSLQKLINHANDVAANDLEQAGQGNKLRWLKRGSTFWCR